MKRIGLAQIWQESNSFNPILTTRSDFENFRFGAGEAALGGFAHGEEVGGFVDGLGSCSEPVRMVPLLFAQAWPGGPLDRETRQWLVESLRREIDAAGRLDGLLISLHGALMAEDEPDFDGLVLETLRRVLGPAAVIVATVDLHAQLTRRMGEYAHALVAYHTNPHIDRFETGVRAAKVLRRILAGAKPELSWIRLPMIAPAELTVTTGPVLGRVFRRLAEMESQSNVLSAFVLMVQPWLDAPSLGWSVGAYADRADTSVRREVEEIAQTCWDCRRTLLPQLLSPPECVATALACPGHPVVIADGADATNSGACGDSTCLLKELLKQPIAGGALTIMVDPQAVARAAQVGRGSPLECLIGGKRDHRFSQPLAVRGTLLSMQPARYILSGHLGNALPIDMGNSAVVQIGDVTVLCTEKPGPGSSPMMYRCVGLEPKDYKIVVVKSPAGFRAEFEPFAAEILLSDGPGCASSHFSDLPYTRIQRPLWPLDDIGDWREAAWLGHAQRGV